MVGNPSVVWPSLKDDFDRPTSKSILLDSTLAGATSEPLTDWTFTFDMGESGMSLTALITAIQEETPHKFSILHPQLAYQALQTKSYAEAIPILDNDIYQIVSEPTTRPEGYSPPPSLSSLALAHTQRLIYQDVVTYFLYGGMIYLATGNHDRAIHFFELATIYPTNNVPSMIQVEAYKKWILLNLIHKGKLRPLSRNLVGQHSRMFDILAKPYQSIAKAFNGSDLQRLIKTVDAGRTIWKEVKPYPFPRYYHHPD